MGKTFLNPFGFTRDLLSAGSPPSSLYGNSKPKSTSDSSSLPPWLGGSGGSGQTVAPQWQFPQYSQTWAFTPPAPSPYMLPPAFDVNSDSGYKKVETPKTPALSIASLMAKYK